MNHQTISIILMGVSGSGKSAVGRALAKRLGRPFLDGDDYHPAENVARMRRGEALDDAARRPWLERLHGLLAEQAQKDEPVVLACSALKAVYRQRLRGNDGLALRFVYLRGDRDLLAERLSNRHGHFFDPVLLDSQLETLEEPERAPAVEIDRPVPAIVDAIISRLSAEERSTGR